MIQDYLSSLRKRISAIGDKSALVLIAPFIIILFLIDKAMAMTLVQWLVFAPVLAGVAIIVSRIVFPQIHLTSLIRMAEGGNRAAGMVASALLIFVALLVLSLVMWAKA